ncbi:DinB family protein [Virgibacillus byunsanensis]|uniref:DinB family protein n=1 Tax=Virgibacillus byunsanensis TaxID=570945 RepID=A0ABW3LTK1_9BACI
MKINKQARDELLAEVEGISDRKLNKKPAAEKWSIKQVLEHLYLIEDAFTKMIQEQLDTGDVVNAKEKPIELTVNRSSKVDAPAFLLPSEEFASMRS